jgi:hypothetical protein
MVTNFLILFKKSPLLALLNSKRLAFSAKNGWRARVAGEPMTSFPNWRCVFEKIRTDFARDWLGGRPRNYLASLEVRGKNSPSF